VITDGGIEVHPVEDLPCLLAWTNAVIWVDIPSCDGDAVRVSMDMTGYFAAETVVMLAWVPTTAAVGMK
jgi:hypothetical protein